MLTIVFKHKFTRWRYVKTHIKPHANRPRDESTLGKPHFRSKTKIVAIKPVIYVFFNNNKSLSFEN